jgi:hypothetical protein
MPLSPQEIEKAKKAVFEKRAAALYARIDASLMEGRTTFAIPDVIGSNDVGAVIRAYEAVGWTVHRMDDRNEGYLKFQSKTEQALSGAHTN